MARQSQSHLTPHRLSVFGLPVRSYRIPGHEPLNAQLRALAHRHERTSPGLAVSSGHAYQSSKTLFAPKDAPEHDAAADAVNQLQAWILMAYRQLRSEIYGMETADTWRPSAMDGWFNIHRPGGFYAAHNHLVEGWHWSGVYYVQADGLPKSQGRLIFEDRIYDHTRGPFALSRLPLVGASHTYEHYFQPETGSLILFPASLYHRVEPFATTSERISIAFDVCDADLRWRLDERPESRPAVSDWLRHYFLGLYLMAVRMRGLLGRSDSR